MTATATARTRSAGPGSWAGHATPRQPARKASASSASGPIHELLTEATEAIRDTDPGDIASVLHRAWTGVCLIGAATEILAVCADADDYRPRRLLA
jgi:hypothetical protein